ncbi:hypothetical protein INT46_002569 [Mucor plumbeus]|uniref:Tc1-like transposase DDE domain-containing protein n=1 Tax=Mucor plumbeus TaxID=97098 RepID=A0A8H7QDX0_9FUNG|nr:hypothetical protein INT46_002569 [Mucor plumbeus]
MLIISGLQLALTRLQRSKSALTVMFERKRYPSVSLSSLTRYKKKFLSSATLPAGGRPSFVSVSTQQYIARMLRNGRQDGPKAVQEYLRSIEIDQWRQWVFSDETRVNLWGSNGNSYYWSDGGDILQPYQTEPHVEGDGGSVLFWGCITVNVPGYGTTVMDGSVDSTVYVDILQTSLLDTLEYYDMDRNVIRFQDWPAQSPDLNPIEHVWYQLKRRLNTYPTRPTTKEELEARITSEWYKFTKNDCLKYIDSMPARIKAVIRSGGGPTRF